MFPWHQDELTLLYGEEEEEGEGKGKGEKGRLVSVLSIVYLCVVNT